jgi:hydrogenase nickel incorporation protein HypA/HybF
VHELGITQEIVAIAAAKAGTARVCRVVVEIGQLTAVLPDAVRFCFDACAEGTPVAGAELDIVIIPGCGRCRACGVENVLDRPLGICECGHTDLEWVAGDELRVRSVEVQ